MVHYLQSSFPVKTDTQTRATDNPKSDNSYVLFFRYTCYSFVYDPWTVLLIEPLHGVTWALMFTVIQSYAASLCPPHLTATGPGIVYAFHLAGMGSLLL